MCSTLFILAMTFERFYSIIRPHKAASFNTVKRAKITIVGIVLGSIIFNIPHWFATLSVGKQCIPYTKGRQYIIGEIYYWVNNVINLFIPFILLIIMNSVIIHTLRRRLIIKTTRSEGQGQQEFQHVKRKHTERQIVIMLLTVTFMFLILTTPGYAMIMFSSYVDYKKSPKSFADFHLFVSIGQKTYFTNYAINFYLYVISGRKFRTDLAKLFKDVLCCKVHFDGETSTSELNTTSTIT